MVDNVLKNRVLYFAKLMPSETQYSKKREQEEGPGIPVDLSTSNLTFWV